MTLFLFYVVERMAKAGISLWLASCWFIEPVNPGRDLPEIGSVVASGSEILVQMEPSQLKVEAGEIVPLGDMGFAVRHPGVRAVIPSGLGSSARISFVYRGATRNTEALASGELRRQIGLKLRAQDTCNVLYVMWHIAPTSGIQVQMKCNPGQRTHQDCRDRGYRSIKATMERPVSAIKIGDRHVLAANIEGKKLSVSADDRLAWEGTLPEEVFSFDGPSGIRTDNGEFDVELWAVPRPGEQQKR